MQVDYLDHMGGDLLVVNAARVSMDNWKYKFDSRDERLLTYLGNHEHISPFFHPQICLRVTAPIYVARQLFRHEVGGAKNEVSRRYVDDTPEIELPTVWRKRPTGGVKQGSGEDFSEFEQQLISESMQQVVDYLIERYDAFIRMGVAPEQARVILPLAMLTKWIWTGSLEFFARVCRHRLLGDAQAETREIALQIHRIIFPLFPHAWKVALRGVEVSDHEVLG